MKHRVYIGSYIGHLCSWRTFYSCLNSVFAMSAEKFASSRTDWQTDRLAYIQ